MNRSQTRIILFHTHAGIGVVVAAFFYIALFFGCISMLSPYIGIWEKRSRTFVAPPRESIDLDAVILPELSGGDWPAEGIVVTLPSRRDPALSIGHRFAVPVYLNPATGAVLEDEGRGLKQFFVDLHWGRVLGRTGVYIMGFGAVGVLFLSINGWWLVFTHRAYSVSLWRWRPSAWLRWHRKLTQWLFPALLILALSSAFIGVMFTLGKGLAYVASNGTTASTHAILGPVVFPKKKTLSPDGRQAEMTTLNQLYATAFKEFGDVDILTLQLNHWMDQNATVTFSGPLKKQAYLTERIHRLSITYRAADGSLVEKQTIQSVHWIKKLLSGFYFLHFMSDAGPVVRWLMFLCGSGLCVGIGASGLAWVRKASRRKKHVLRHLILSRLFIAVFAGVIPATAMAFLLQWLLPLHLAERMVWLKGGFYLTWQAGLVWALILKSEKRAMGSLLLAAGALLMAAPIAHGVASGFFVWRSLMTGMTAVAGVDIGLLCFGAIALWCGYRLHAPFAPKLAGSRQ